MQERFQTEGALEAFFNFEDFAMGEFFPTGSDGRIVAEAVEEELDLFCDGRVFSNGVRRENCRGGR